MWIHADPDESKTLLNTCLSQVWCAKSFQGQMACRQILELTLARNPTAAFSVQNCLRLEVVYEDI
jgi:hypothetical protein